MSVVGERICQHRGEAGLTLSEVARSAGVAKGFLWQVENGGRNPSGEWLAKVAAVLGVAVTDLLGAAPPAPPDDVPVALTKMAADQGLTADDVATLAAIHWRGRQPGTTAGWLYLWNTLRLVAQAPAEAPGAREAAGG